MADTITTEVKLVEKVKFLSLQDSPKEWKRVFFLTKVKIGAKKKIQESGRHLQKQDMILKALRRLCFHTMNKMEEISCRQSV